MVPAAFQGIRALRYLNCAAVGFALAAATGALGGVLLDDTFYSPARTMMASVLPTIFIGAAWAYLLGWKRTLRNSQIRVGWVLSLPLAVLNGALACGLAGASDLSSFVGYALAGATFGVLAWGPGLMAVLLCFGLPIGHAQHLAKKGLAGEENGERIVGAVCLALGLASLLFSAGMSDGFELQARARAGTFDPAVSVGMVRALAVLGALTGVVSVLLSTARARRRRRFVREVQEQKVPGYRIDDTAEGKVLLRVFTHGEGYRVMDFQEELVTLDEEGEARHAVSEPR